VISLFAREITDDLASLVKQIDKTVADNSDAKLAAMLVLLSEDPEADEAKLQDLAERLDIENVPLTIFDGPTGPANYKLDESAELTVVMWVDQEIQVKRPYAAGEFKQASIKDVLQDTAKILE